MGDIPYSARLIGRISERLSSRGYGLAARLARRRSDHEEGNEILRRNFAGKAPSVIDIGANVGQFADYIFDLAPTARVLSIEPIPENVEALRSRFADRPGYEVIQCAVGETTAPAITFHVSPYSQASSILPPSETARSTFRSLSGATREITVPLFRLDDLMAGRGDTQPIDLLKIDVEGFEGPVLRGAQNTLARSRLLHVETQVKSMNDGSELFDEVCHRARAAGLRLAAVPGEVRDLFGQLLMLDLLFERTGH